MRGSSLVTRQLPLTGGFTRGRSGQQIRRITWHHVAGNLPIETIRNVLQGANISATYGVQDNQIGQYICEDNRPWTSSNAVNDNQAITIEISNDESVMARPGNNTLNGRVETVAQRGDRLGWPISAASYETAIRLTVDCMQRNNMPPLVVGETLTWHSMFSATNCPGPWIMERLQQIADECNRRAFGVPSGSLWGVARQVIALSDREAAQAWASRLNAQRKDPAQAFYHVIERPRQG